MAAFPQSPATYEARGRPFGAGLAAGLAGGVVLYALMISLSLAQGGSLWPILKGAALPFFDASRITSPQFDLAPVAIGVLAHFSIAALWGALFGLFFFGLSRGATIFAGVFWGVVVWLLMFYVVLPLVGAAQVARSSPVSFAVLEHVVFGVSVAAAFLPFQRRAPRPWQRLPRRVGVDRHAPA